MTLQDLEHWSVADQESIAAFRVQGAGVVSESTNRFEQEQQWYRDLDLCDELIEQGALKPAMRWLTVMHTQRPDAYEVQELILDVLFKQGLSERDFEWLFEPSVVRLGKGTRERIYQWLKAEAEWADVCEIRFMVFWGEYLCFEEEALARDLKQDKRFVVEKDGPSWMLNLTELVDLSMASEL